MKRTGAILCNGHLRVVQVFQGWDAPRCVKCAPVEKRTFAAAAALVVDDNTGKSVELCRQHCTLLGLDPQPVNGALYFGRELAYVLSHEQRRAIEEVPVEVMAAELRCAPVLEMPRRKQVATRISPGLAAARVGPFRQGGPETSSAMLAADVRPADDKGARA